MNIFLIRHAESVLNKKNIIQGWENPELSEAGLVQAQRLAGAFPQDIPIISSDLQRAKRTAEFVASPHGERVQLDARLREVHVGHWQGFNKSDLSDDPLWTAYQTNPEHFQFPGGESLHDVQQRMMTVASEHILLGQDVILVSHRLALRSLVCYFTKRSLADLHTIDIPNASITWVELTAGFPVMHGTGMTVDHFSRDFARYQAETRL